MVYKGKFTIKKGDLEHYKRLLEIETFEKLNEEEMNRIGAKKDDYIEIGCVEFSNGNYLTIDLCSGCSNYFDNVVLYDMYGTEIELLDCNYEIGNLSINIVEMEMLK